jgi:hypothetical protein
VIVDSMQKFQTARDVTQQEANSLARVFMLATQLEPPDKDKLQKLCMDYSEEVINVEWRLMDDGKYSAKARRTAINIYQSALAATLKTPNQQSMYQVLVQDAGDLWNARRDRINMAQYGVPPVEWVVLLIGAVITIVFTYLFGLENRRLQTIMTAMVTGLISLNLYLLLLYGYPFSGDLCIGTNSFVVDEGIFHDKITNSAVPTEDFPRIIENRH